MIDKDRIIRRVNARMAATCPNAFIAEREHDAPRFHALIAAICDEINECMKAERHDRDR